MLLVRQTASYFSHACFPHLLLQRSNSCLVACWPKGNIFFLLSSLHLPWQLPETKFLPYISFIIPGKVFYLCVLGQQLLCFVMLHKHEPAEPGKQIRCDLSYCTVCSEQRTCKVKCHAAPGIMQCSVQFGDSPIQLHIIEVQVNVKEGKQNKGSSFSYSGSNINAGLLLTLSRLTTPKGIQLLERIFF